MAADDHDAVDARLRRAWADRAPADGELVPVPPQLWAGLASATAGDDVAARAARPTRGRVALALLGAATLVLAALVGARALDDDGPAVEQVAVLRPEEVDGPAGAGGDASVVGGGDERVLEVALHDVPDPGADEVIEVWLFDPVSGEMQAMGLIGGGDVSRLELPAGLDLDRYTVVDVSLEPLDGDPAHSATSLLRGPLQST